MATVKRHDFVEIDYTGRLKEDNSVFDTTSEKTAEESGLHEKENKYSPLVICVGEENLLKAVDDQIIGKEVGNEFTFEVQSENAFGRKDARLIQLIPLSKFRQQSIQPVPGLQLNIDGLFGIVKTVSGGRCYVDFNHPLAGKDLIYEIKINRIVEDGREKLGSLLKMHLGIKDAEIELKDGSASIKSKKGIPKEAQEDFRKIAERAISTIKSIEFEKNKENKEIKN